MDPAVIESNNHPTSLSNNSLVKPVNVKSVIKASCNYYEFLILRNSMNKNGPMSPEGSKLRNDLSMARSKSN